MGSRRERRRDCRVIVDVNNCAMGEGVDCGGGVEVCVSEGFYGEIWGGMHGVIVDRCLEGMVIFDG